MEGNYEGNYTCDCCDSVFHESTEPSDGVCPYCGYHLFYPCRGCGDIFYYCDTHFGANVDKSLCADCND